LRSLFGKQLILYLGILIISFVFLGLALSQVIRGYFENQRVHSLTDSAQRIAYAMEGRNQFGVINLRQINNEINILHQYLDAKVVIIDADFHVLGDSGHLADPDAKAYAPELEALTNETLVIIYGNMNQVFNEPFLTVGYPYKWNGEYAGAVLVSTSMAELEAAVFGMYRITLLCLAVVALFASALIYLSSRAISKPLRQMNEAAGVIAEGDFEKRIPVHSKDEVGQLAGQFNIMAESLQEQEKIRRAFIANLSHDLRSPLTSMRGFLQAIQDGTVAPEKQPYYLNIVLDESERLIKLSNDILDIHRLQEADITLNRSVFDINELIRRTVMYFEKQALDKKLTINCHFAHSVDLVYADADMVQRVVYNLLDNAIKFTQPGTGEITVETTVENKKATVSVADNGRGISLDEQKRIFDRFYKGDPSRNEDKMGSGLGLSIVKEFLRGHGENIQVKSEPDKGSVFTFTLPTGDT
jgi:signal transduction histidine kinase